MRKIITEDEAFERVEVDREKAVEIVRDLNQPLKVEHIETGLAEHPSLSFYRQGEFVDLCAGPHVESTGAVKHFKLLSMAGAYWRGNENNPMLTRIYGVVFPTEEELVEYLNYLEEVKKRDHRRLGKELELFGFFEEAGSGFVFYFPKGVFLRNRLIELSRKEHLSRGYVEISSPHIMKSSLWHISGHYQNYRENMFVGKTEDYEFVVKPMNCPAHILFYKKERRSYRELPLKILEFGTVYRNERAGTMHGLMRVRGFTQDDAHIFTTHQRLKEDIKEVLDFVFHWLSLFNFTYSLKLKGRPKKFIGTVENWERAIESLRGALEEMDLAYEFVPEDGAFYGPKIDVVLKDALEREWQGPTIQVDFNLPERFDLIYVGSDGKEHRPVMIHRAIMGSVERFLGVLLEHYGGKFPVWLSPVQGRILPISEKFVEYGERVESLGKEMGLRIELDRRNEKLGYKIREAIKQKIPYLLIVGKKEVESGTVSVRSRDEGELGEMKPAEIFNKIAKEEESRK
jgi:threonyl-tRNA synthetase